MSKILSITYLMDVDGAFLTYICYRIQDITSKPSLERQKFWISPIQEIAFTSISFFTRNQAANEVRLISTAIKDINEIDPESEFFIEVTLFGQSM